MDRPQLAVNTYAGQFELATDPLHIAIPREEIVEEMARHGEELVLNRVCMAVAVVLDLFEQARR
jgi:hypothetical protein